MKQRNIRVSIGAVTRLVTHLDVDRAGLETLVAAWRDFLAQ